MSAHANTRAIGNVLVVTAYQGLGLLLTLGLVALQAAAFGTSVAADAFYFARQMLSSASALIDSWLQKVFVPIFVRDAADDEAVLASRLKRLTLILGIGSLAATGVLVLLAPQIVAVMAPGFGPEQSEAAITVFRILSVGMPFSVIAGLYSAQRFSRRRFGIASLAKLLPRAAGLLGFAAAGLGLSVFGLAWWMVAGMAAMAGLLVWRSFEHLSGGSLRKAAKPEASDKSERRAGAVSIAIGGQMLLGWCNAFLASFGPAGTMALMFLGLRLLNAAPGKTNTAVSTVYYTEYAEGAQQRRSEQARQIGAGLRLSMFFVVPLSCLLLFATEPLIRFLLERGSFGPEDTAILTVFVIAMVPSLTLNALNGTMMAAFLADTSLKGVRVALISNGAAIAVRLGLGLVLLPTLGLLGLALAILASSAAYLAVLMVTLTRAYGPLLIRSDWIGLARLTAASGCASGVGILLLALGLHIIPTIALFGAAFLVAAAALSVPEVSAMTNRFPRLGPRARA